MQHQAENEYSVTSLAHNEWLSFAVYSVENRAIPSMVDGLKPVQRFYLYSSIENTKTKFDKVAAVSGLLAKYGYNHGEASAAAAGIAMAQEWNNNVCLIEGRGAFGTRLVQSAGAARYVYTRLHENFSKYIKDVDLAPIHPDPEHEPPAYYIPVIPLVLINGIKGIATGFACEILPRSPEDLITAVEEYITTGKVKNKLLPSFPDFSGKVEEVEPGKFKTTGVYERTSKTGLVITDVPIGNDRESYVSVLNKLEEDGVIVSFDDCCDKTGFNFKVTLKRNMEYSDADILKLFKLEKTFSENLTVIDEHGKLKLYDSPVDILKDFVDFRMKVMGQRIKVRLAELKEKMRWMLVKKEFIDQVLNNKIVLKGRTKDEIKVDISKIKYYVEGDENRLLAMNILSLTKEMVDTLSSDIIKAKDDVAIWRATNEAKQFISDLEGLTVSPR